MFHLTLTRRITPLFLALLVFSTTLGCYSRVQIKSSRLPKIEQVPSLQFMMLDSSAPISNSWKMVSHQFGQDSLKCTLKRLDEKQAFELYNLRNSNDYSRNADKVLLYVSTAAGKTLNDSMEIRLSYNDILKIEVFEPDAGKAVGIFFASCGAMALVAVLVFIITCNCPHAYAELPDGSRSIEGSLYSGAIYPSLERADYLPMRHLQPLDGEYRIHLVNQDAQRQHTDMLRLEMLECPPGVMPIFDQNGRLHTIEDPQPPRYAADVSGHDVTGQVIGKDGLFFLGDLEQDAPDAVERLTLRFDRPAGTTQAKLLVNARNTEWLDQTYYALQTALGEYADEVARRFSRKSAKANRAWAEKQKIPLSVWVEAKPGTWEKAGTFDLAGDAAHRDMVLPLELPQNTGGELRVRLDFGFHFWEIDQVALDFSENRPVRHISLSPLRATDQHGNDVTAALADDDGRYYDQPNLGDEARAVFPAPDPLPGMERHLVLHGKGWYELAWQNAPGRPKLSQLKRWEKENALPMLARERWQAAHVKMVEK